jgi:hypothetical protein
MLKYICHKEEESRGDDDSRVLFSNNKKRVIIMKGIKIWKGGRMGEGRMEVDRMESMRKGEEGQIQKKIKMNPRIQIHHLFFSLSSHNGSFLFFSCSKKT